MNTNNRSPLSDDDTGGAPEQEILMPIANDMAPAVAAEINQQVATAKKYPRRRDVEISNEILGRATLNAEIAAECMYSLKRGDKTITGPSIRFAEIVRGSFGNIRVAARFVRLDLDDPDRGAVIVEAAAIDLQTNNAECIPVRRSVMTSGKGGRRAQVFSADMINMTVNAASSIARRNAILAVAPKSVWIDGFQRVVKVLQGDGTTLAARRKEMIDAFGRIGVTAARVFEALGVKSIEDITVEHMPALVGFATAIKEGESPDQVFGRAAGGGEPTHATVDNPLQDKDGDAPVRKNTSTVTAASQAADAAAAGADIESGELPAQGSGEAAGEGAPTGDATGQPDKAAAQDAPKTKATAPAKVTDTNAKATSADHAEDLAAIATPSEYEAYALAWIAKGTDAKAIRAQWTAERAKRKDLDLAEDTLSRVSLAYQTRVRELTASE